jgi:hypothetical protein
MKRQALLLTGTLALASACVVVKPGVLDAGEDDDTGGDPDDDEDSDEDDDGPDPSDTGGTPDLPDPDPDPDPDGDGCAQKLDILVVIDNSGSMGEEQRNMTDSFPLLVNGLDAAGVDWRLAVTTSDSGNMWCPAGTTSPEFGSFVFASCKSRLGDFLFGEDINVQDLACNNICNLDDEQLEALPTTTDDDPMAKPRPWLQREAGQLNLPVGVDAAEAIRCLVPQGINGCGFEQQLESMRSGLARTTNPNAPEAGFLRDDASLLVLLITDEVDCSVRPEFEQAVFAEDGTKAFWADPQAAFPTSAVCWNAGVECTGDPSDYDDCVPADKNVLGQPAEPPQAVLYPVSRYANTLAAIEQSKHAIDPGLDVAVLAISGVGLDGTITYADVGDTDPSFQDSFGIGPGCTAPNPLDPGEPVTAVPPVRVRAVAEALSTDPLSSICAENFDDFMLATLERFVGGC